MLGQGSHQGQRSHFIKIHQEDITILNSHAANNKKLIEVYGKMDKSIVTVGNFNTLLLEIVRKSTQKMSKNRKDMTLSPNMTKRHL